MKNSIKTLAIIFTLLLSFSSCETDDDLTFVAAPQGEFEFNNTFLAEYVLPAATSTDGNIGAVFTFNEADFDVQTNVSYELQSSIVGDFSDATIVSTLSNANNQIEISIGTLKSLAADYAIEAPNSGILNFRVRAFPGNTSSTTEMFTPTQQLTITLLEETSGGGSGIEPATWGVVGSGYNNWGAFEDATFYTTAEAGIIVSYVNLLDGEIKFRENNTWGGDLGDANGDGVLDADPDNNISVTAGDYKITINTNDNSYTIEPFSWGIVGSGYNNWGETPDAKLSYDYTTDTFKVGVRLVDGEIKLRPNNTWGGDLGDSDGDGVLDTNDDNNIDVTEGHYLVTVNLNDNSYSIVATDIWGIVGSGYNNWGETPDFSLTEVNPNIWIAENVALLDGEIKIRANNAWDVDYGDADSDGVLDQDDDNNITVTAGNYVVKIDFTDPGAPAYTLGARQ